MKLVQHKLTKKLTAQESAAQIFLVVFYVVGIAGMISSFTSELFLKLIPLALFLSFALLMAFHSGKFSTRLILGLFLLYLISFFIEVAGVKTGIIFGSYHYGENLGLKIFGTPLIIGINWLFLSYAASSVVFSLGLRGFWAIISAALLMVFYDVFLEQVAPYTDMWHWTNDRIPAQNFLAWLILSIFFQLWLVWFKIKTKNSLAWLILLCQFVLLFSLTVWYKKILG